MCNGGSTAQLTPFASLLESDAYFEVLVPYDRVSVPAILWVAMMKPNNHMAADCIKRYFFHAEQLSKEDYIVYSGDGEVMTRTSPLRWLLQCCIGDSHATGQLHLILQLGANPDVLFDALMYTSNECCFIRTVLEYDGMLTGNEEFAKVLRLRQTHMERDPTFLFSLILEFPGSFSPASLRKSIHAIADIVELCFQCRLPLYLEEYTHMVTYLHERMGVLCEDASTRTNVQPLADLLQRYESEERVRKAAMARTALKHHLNADLADKIIERGRR
jgi:hypothetical protein